MAWADSVLRCGPDCRIAAFHLATTVRNRQKPKPSNIMSHLSSFIMAEAGEKGYCTHPGCDWRGAERAHPKHQKGAGIGSKRVAGKHEGCDCCKFQRHSSATNPPAQSVLQHTLSLIEQVNGNCQFKIMLICVHRSNTRPCTRTCKESFIGRLACSRAESLLLVGRL
jgi:Protein of unknown function (DUF2946)